MGKSYIGDFEFNASFDVNASKPFDTRFVVDNVSDLSNAISYPYVGLLVYVKADGKYYSYQETSTNVYEWVELQTSGGGGGDINTSNIYSYTSKYKSLGAVGDYARCVIALCKVTSTTNSSQYSFSDGTIVGARDNGLTPNYVAKVSMQDYYTNALSCTYNLQSNYENTSTTALSGDGFRACIFKYNNEYYGGLEFYQIQARNWHWYGVGNFTPFIVSYYNTNTSSAINSEINNSLTFSGPIRNKNSFYGDLNGKATYLSVPRITTSTDANGFLSANAFSINEYQTLTNSPNDSYPWWNVISYNGGDGNFGTQISNNLFSERGFWYRQKIGGAFNSWARILDTSRDSSGGAYIISPRGASFQTNTPTTTGALKITLPQSWTSTMLRFYVDIYNYDSTSGATTYLIGGYNYIKTQLWYNCSAKSFGGDSTRNNLKVRFGHDGSKCCVYIGETNTTWDYVQVKVRDFYAGYGGFEPNQWDSGWSITFATSLGTITQTVSDVNTLNCNISGSANSVINKPSYAFSEITGSITTNQMSAGINNLTTGSSDPTDADYYVTQYAGGGTSTTSYHRRPHSALYNYIKNKASGTWAINVSGNATNVSGTVAIGHGGTGATTRLGAAQALTNESVATPEYVVGLTTSWGKFGYTSISQLKTTLGINKVNNNTISISASGDTLNISVS